MIFLQVGSTPDSVLFSIDCNSDSETLAALLTAEKKQQLYFAPKDVVLLTTPKSSRYAARSGGWTRQGFCRDLDPCWFEWLVDTIMCPVDSPRTSL